MPKLIDPNSAIFLISESRNQPMHVAGLQLFEPPPGASPDFVRELFEHTIQTQSLAPLFLRKPVKVVPGVGPWAWTEDKQFDIEYHVRHSALPKPGRIRELFELVSRLHGSVLRRERPLWEAHLIEGLNDGRFAIYTKVHHSLVDGISAMRIMQRSLSEDPDERGMGLAFQARSRRLPRPKIEAERTVEVPLSAVRSAYAMAADAAGLPGALAKTLSHGVRNEASSISFYAPRSMLNRPITGARRFAADDWPLERLRGIAAATDTTLNDVVLAMCGGALRHYMQDHHQLPDSSLVAMVPVGLKSRSKHQEGQGGNAVGSVMAKLATDVADPADRLTIISESMKAGKELLSAMTPAQILAMSGLGMAPSLVYPGLQNLMRPPFNLIISNVPGPKNTLYFNGARMTGTYPVSVPMNGFGLNITCNSYGEDMEFGLTGCRQSVPHLQRLLSHLDTELGALEKAAGL